MKQIIDFATWFMGLFQAGGKQFANWVATIIPLVLIMLVFMNALIAMIGQKKMNKFAQASASNPLMRYMILPFLAAFMLGNPLAHIISQAIMLLVLNFVIQVMEYFHILIQLNTLYGWELQQAYKS